MEAKDLKDGPEATETLWRNITALEKKCPEAAEKLEGEGARVVLEEAKSEGLTFKYSGRYFHSRYNPAREAMTQAEEIMKNKADWVVLFGLGCGYLLRELVEKTGMKILVYEPSAEILKGVLSGVDLSETLSDDRVFFADTAHDAARTVRDHVSGMDDLIGYQTSPYRRVFAEELVEFTKSMENAHTSTQVAIKTDIDSRKRWVDNYLANVEHFAECPPVDVLKDKFKDVPMVVVGAGPSLKKNVHVLKKLKGKVIIVAAVTAYRALLNHGVVPDYVVAAEKKDLPHYFTGTEVDKEVGVILADVSHPGFFARKMGRKFVFFNAYINLSQAHAVKWGSEYFASIGGSVTTAALDMGVLLGCPAIILIGQDLAFGINETHAGGGVYESGNTTLDLEKGVATVDMKYTIADEKRMKRFKILWLKGVDGRPVPSKFDWVTFHQWFETYMRKLKATESKVKVINATEGGAYIEGMDHMTLAEAADKHVQGPVDIEKRIEQAVTERKPADYDGLSKSFKEMQEGLRYINRKAGSILREVARIRKRLKKEGLTPGLRKNLASIRRDEKELFEKASNTGFLWEALSAYRYELEEYLKKDEDEDINERFNSDLEVMEKSYTEVREMCEKLAPDVEKSVELLKVRAERSQDERTV